MSDIFNLNTGNIVQSMKDGQIVNPTGSLAKKANEAKDTKYDTEMFLKLLVAEMQYQDPLEPTSNTEWVSQMATFSQIEGIQDMGAKMESMQANNLVGKYVIMKTTDGNGVSTTVAGTVDYVYYNEGKTLLAVNDGLYDIKDLDTVADDRYVKAVAEAAAFDVAVAKLPTVEALIPSDEKFITAARKLFDEMDDYSKQFVNEKSVKNLEKLEERIKALKILQGIADEVNNSEDKGESSGASGAESSDNTAGTDQNPGAGSAQGGAGTS